MVGATSAIAVAMARSLAEQGYSFTLAARNSNHLEMVAADLAARGANEVDVCLFDAVDQASWQELLATIDHQAFDMAVLAHGVLPDQTTVESDALQVAESLMINGTSIVSLLGALAHKFRLQRRGTLIVLSSVAGERGRKSNYVYGSAKAAVTTFCEGLRMQLAGTNVSVVTALIGMVDTPMTEDFKKGLLWSTPQVVAHRILRQVERGGGTVYAPWYWRYIMLVVCLLPESILRRLPI
jgi:short-subunit dehydrogenase